MRAMNRLPLDSTAAEGAPRGAAPVAVSHWRGGWAILRLVTQGSRLTRRGFWIFQMVFWILSWLALKTMLHTFYGIPNAATIALGRILTGFLLTCFIYAGYGWMYRQRFGSWVSLAWIGGFNALAVLAGAAAWSFLLGLGFAELPSQSPLASLTLARMYSLMTWNFALFAVEFILAFDAARMDAAEAKWVARASELKQLQSQLNPHFLFNALNSIIASADSSVAVREVTQNLADYLRFSLHEARQMEPLGRELDALESYLELQRVRFQEGLECRIAASPAARRVMVPPMIIQPLLENAFKFGRRRSAAPLSLSVEAVVAEGFLTVEVSNSGAWVEPGTNNTTGTGLSNLRRRLDLLLGESATLVVKPGAAAVVVTIRLPVESHSVSLLA